MLTMIISVKHRARGFTLVELMVTLTVLGVLLTIAVPSFLEWLQRDRLKSAGGALYSDLQYARVTAVARNATTYVTFNFNDGWCYGISDSNASCNCNTAGSCTVDGVQKVSKSSDYPGVTLTATDISINGGGTTFAFDPRRGMAEDPAGVRRNGSVEFDAPTGDSLRVEVNILGRVSQCSSTLSGYNASC